MTSAVFAREDHVTTGRWNALRTTNTVGWTVSLVGAGLLTLGIVLPKVKTAKTEVALVPGINGASV